MKQFILTCLLIPSLSLAAQTHCPDLSDPQHENPIKQGWSVAMVSPSQDVMGSKKFSNVKISNIKVAGANWVMCWYGDEELALIQYGKFNHPPLSEIWYHTYYYDQCDSDLEACYFMSHK